MDAEHRKIPRSTIVDLLARLPLVGVDCASRDYDADLFRAIDSRPVRRAAVMENDVTLSALRVDALDAAIMLREMLPLVREDWISETHVLKIDGIDDSGAHIAEIGRHGYFDADGQFIEDPVLELIPHFTTKVDDALKLKTRVFGVYLRLAIEEEDNVDWGTEYSVRLLSWQSDVVYAHRAVDLPHAIIGAVLGAMLAGWAHELLPFEIEENENDDV